MHAAGRVVGHALVRELLREQAVRAVEVVRLLELLEGLRHVDVVAEDDLVHVARVLAHAHLPLAELVVALHPVILGGSQRAARLSRATARARARAWVRARARPAPGAFLRHEQHRGNSSAHEYVYCCVDDSSVQTPSLAPTSTRVRQISNSTCGHRYMWA